MVDQSFETCAASQFDSLLYCLLQCLHGNGRAERVGKLPADNLVRVGIGYQMKVADAPVGKHNVSDVAHPQLIGRYWYKILHQVLPLVITVVRTGCVPGFGRREHQTVTAKKRKEAVTPGDELCPEKGGEHDPKLATSNAGILLSDFMYVFHYDAFALQLLLDVGLRLVEGLTAMAK